MKHTTFAGLGIDLDGQDFSGRDGSLSQSEPQLDTSALPEAFRPAARPPPGTGIQYDAAKTADPTTPESIALKHGITAETLARLQDAFVSTELRAKWILTFNREPGFREIMNKRAKEHGRSTAGGGTWEIRYDVPRKEFEMDIAKQCGIEKAVVEELRKATLTHIGRRVFGPGYELRTESYAEEETRKFQENDVRQDQLLEEQQEQSRLYNEELRQREKKRQERLEGGADET